MHQDGWWNVVQIGRAAGSWAFLVPLLPAAVLIFMEIGYRISYRYVKFLFRARRTGTGVWAWILGRLERYPRISGRIHLLAQRAGMCNSLSFETNCNLACCFMAGAILLMTAGCTAAVVRYPKLWYMGCVYAMMCTLASVLAWMLFGSYAKARFTHRLPGTYKLICSRYITHGNILKALDACMPDFEPAVGREMLRVYDTLKKNDAADVERLFNTLEKAYDNEYFTLLLILIRQAYHKGGNDIIKQQFEQATEEILVELENQKDLSAAGNAYIILALFMLPGMKGIEWFNARALGEEAGQYYHSAQGLQAGILFLIALLAYAAYLIYMEKSV